MTSHEKLAVNRPNDAHAQRKIVRWENPPDTASLREGRRRTAYREITEELRANPGRWARLDDRATASAAYQFVLSVVRGTRSAFRPVGAYEAASRNNQVWVRYVGPAEEDDVSMPYADQTIEPNDPDRAEPSIAGLRTTAEAPRVPDTKHAFAF